MRCVWGEGGARRAGTEKEWGTGQAELQMMRRTREIGGTRVRDTPTRSGHAHPPGWDMPAGR